MKNKVLLSLLVALSLTSCKSTDLTGIASGTLNQITGIFPVKYKYPDILQVYPVFIADSYKTHISAEDINFYDFRKKFNIDPDETSLYLDETISQKVSVEDYRKLEKSADCDFANSADGKNVLICIKEPKNALLEYKERPNAEEYVKQNSNNEFTIKWEEKNQYGGTTEYSTYKLKEHPNLIERIKNDSKCKINRSETMAECKHAAPSDLKVKSSLLPSSGLKPF